jgi:hypothetical protein
LEYILYGKSNKKYLPLVIKRYIFIYFVDISNFRQLMKTIYFSILLSIIGNIAFSQYYSSGQDPASIQWKQINSTHFKVIVPQEADSLGLIYTNYLENIYSSRKNSLDILPKKIPVILHTQTAISNGEVAWAPKRINLYSIAPQDNFFQHWEEHLSLHEFRHVSQIGKVNHHAPRYLQWMFGEQIAPAIIGLYVPMWFLEGDAVCFETYSGKAGRGRVADFSMKLKAQWLSWGEYSYAKAMFGSYKDFVPNHYDLGYQLTAYGYANYGNGFWKNNIESAAKDPLLYNPFSRSIKRQTGKNEPGFYHEAAENIAVNWTSNNSSAVTMEKKEYINYYSPQQLNHTSLVALKTTFFDIPAFVIASINFDGKNNAAKEKTLCKPGSVADHHFHLMDSVLVWNEYDFTRWSHKTYCNIKIFDLRENKTRKVTTKEKCFHSCISPNGKMIVSCEYDDAFFWKITIREITTGKVVKYWDFKKNQPAQPSWSEGGKEITFVEIGKEGKSIGLINIDSNTISYPLQNIDNQLEFPKFIHGALYCKADIGTKSTIVRFNKGNDSVYYLDHDGYGIGNFQPYKANCIFSKYTANGFTPVIELFEHFEPINENQLEYPAIWEKELNGYENTVDFSQQLNNYPIKKYSKLMHLFKIHSWSMPIAIQAGGANFGPGVSIMSQNDLSSSFMTAGYLYNIQDKLHNYYLEYDYKGWYPVISVRYNHYRKKLNGYDKDNMLRTVERYSNQFTGYLTVPFQRNINAWNLYCGLGAAYTYSHRQLQDTPWFKTDPYNLQYASASIYASFKQRMCHRDLQPKWGVDLSLRNYSSVFASYKPTLSSVSCNIYLPGFIKNHGLKFYAGLQVKDDENSIFVNPIAFPTGLTVPDQSKTISAMKAEYLAPLFYPDVDFFNQLYIKRLKSRTFFHFANNSYYDTVSRYHTVGVELSADFHLLRFIAPIEMGIIYSAPVDNLNKQYIGFVFNVGFYDI